jgi:hypothetical protein
MYKKSKYIISLDVFFPNLKEHKHCFERLLKRTQEEGFSSLLVHPSFQAEHNRNGKYLVYIETTNLFYATDDISGYVGRCISNGIKPENICAINKKGEYVKITFQK